LDLDGTLLDLHFDTHFWTEHVPTRYAERHGLDPEAARAEVIPKLRAKQGTLEWYCLDYWTAALGLEIAALKEEVQHLIAVHPEVESFLSALRASRRRVALVTNAHGKSLSLKLDRTGLDPYFDAVYCSHDFGLPKEAPGFWEKLRAVEPFEPARTLLIDDNVAVLRSARDYGIAYLIDVLQPDSRRPPKTPVEFPMIAGFRDIMPG
jgi:putative hydrolase of the HAD superfamily